MTRQTTLSLALGALMTFGLAGCGLSGSNGAINPQASTVSLASVYSVGGQPQLIVKRKAGTRALTLAKNLRHVRNLALTGVEIDAVTDGNLDAAISALKADPSVEYVEPNYKITIPEKTGNLRADQNPNFPGEYGPKLTHALEAFDTTIGEGQVIAVVDTGVDLTHPDFAGKLVEGTNTVDAKATAADDQGHGTNCAGIAASLKDDKGGIVGMAPGAKVMPVKVLGADGSGSDASVYEGVRWAADHGATVISMSLGGSRATQTGTEAIAYALKKGCVIVAAMGNNGRNEKSYPAAYPGVLSVGATDINDKVTFFSQWGDWISVSAPGYSILSTMPTYRVSSNDDYDQNKASWEKYGMRATMTYGYMTGTSQATPHVSGLVALVRSTHPNFTPDQVKKQIEKTAVRLPGMTGSFDLHYGYGRIDARQAIR